MELPFSVVEEFKKLKQEFPYHIILQSKNKSHYVYKQSTQWDKEKKKVRTTRAYLGKITDSGRFIKKAVREISSSEITQPDYEELSLDEKDKRLLTVLSMNARADLSFFGREIGLKPDETYRRVRSLEKKLGITYITEIDVEKLGYLKFLIMVKFLDTKPTIDEIKQTAEKEHNVQLALLVNGDYDAIFYAFIKNTESDKIVETIINLRVGALEKYPSRWYATPFYEHHGFVPVRNEFIDQIKKELKKREYAVLREINKNSIITFTDIDRIYRLDHIHSGYVFSSLKEKGIIKRATISVERLPIKYLGIIQEEIINEMKFRKKRKHSLEHISEEIYTPINKYILGGDIENPDGSLLFVPVFKDGELDSQIEKIKGLHLGLNIKAMIITSVLLGSLCFRRFDLKYSKQHAVLVDTYGVKNEKLADYESSDRSKIQKLD